MERVNRKGVTSETIFSILLNEGEFLGGEKYGPRLKALKKKKIFKSLEKEE